MLATGVRSAVPITADAKLAAAAILGALGKEKQSTTQPGAVRAKTIREAVQKGLWPACRTHGKLMEIVARALPDVIVAGDQTEPVYATNQTYQAPQPRSISMPAPAAALGGLPAAFGASSVPQAPRHLPDRDGACGFPC
jgi:acetolactate synthase-1/2/3 large subunit